MLQFLYITLGILLAVSPDNTTNAILRAIREQNSAKPMTTIVKKKKVEPVVDPLPSEIPNNMIVFQRPKDKVEKVFRQDAFNVPVDTITFNNDRWCVFFKGEVTKIGKEAFKDCRYLKAIILPPSVTTIEERAFCNCEDLERVVLSDGITRIEANAFDRCTDLVHIRMGEQLAYIGDNAFLFTKIDSVHLPSTLTTIGRCAFACCNDLRSINIPNSVTSMGDSVLAGAGSLTSIVIGDGIKSLPKFAFSGCVYLASVTLPARLQSIGKSAFEYCGSLKTIEFPKTLTSIGGYAFAQAGLTEALFPAGLQNIGSFAFAVNSKLVEMTFLGVTPPTMGIGCFDEIAPATISVPSQNIEAYKAEFKKSDGMPVCTVQAIEK